MSWISTKHVNSRQREVFVYWPPCALDSWRFRVWGSRCWSCWPTWTPARWRCRSSPGVAAGFSGRSQVSRRTSPCLAALEVATSTAGKAPHAERLHFCRIWNKLSVRRLKAENIILLKERNIFRNCLIKFVSIIPISHLIHILD